MSKFFCCPSSPVLNESDDWAKGAAARLGGHAEGRTPTCIWTRMSTELCGALEELMSDVTLRHKVESRQSQKQKKKLQVGWQSACCWAAKWSALEKNVGQAC